MFYQNIQKTFVLYNRARKHIINNPEILINIEKYLSNFIWNMFCYNIEEFATDYNEASKLYPFWANYPPEERGRQPKGDQIPWIEVGEHAIGHKASRIISNIVKIREIGLPTGADNRFLVDDEMIYQITSGFTGKVMVYLDIKSVGPRDNPNEVVVSPFQVSGDGKWEVLDSFMTNSPIQAQGNRATHLFYPAVSPIYILSDGSIAPTFHLFVKPIYTMLNLENPGQHGQPLIELKSICVPNGLLLTENPNYNLKFPGLFYPGKDAKEKTPLKIRARISTSLLQEIACWRVNSISVN